MLELCSLSSTLRSAVLMSSRHYFIDTIVGAYDHHDSSCFLLNILAIAEKYPSSQNYLVHTEREKSMEVK